MSTIEAKAGTILDIANSIGPDAEVITPELMKKDDHPDSFFAVNDDTAIGIMYAAKRMGFKVPDDISICGFTTGQYANCAYLFCHCYFLHI